MAAMTYRRFLLYFLRLGTTVFGGSLAMADRMEQDLVWKHGWVAPEEFQDGMTLCLVLPGPVAPQLAVYFGLLRYGRPGGLLAGILLLVPSFLMTLLLAVLYRWAEHAPWLQAAFHGAYGAVLGIIVRSAFDLARGNLKSNWLLIVLFLVSTGVTLVTGDEYVWFFLACGVLALIVLAPSKSVKPALPALFPFPFSGPTLSPIFIFFAKASLLVFGSGLVALPFLHEGVVRQFHWVTERQFLDSIAIGLMTPGPILMSSGFLGYLTAGGSGAVAATVGLFFPAYALILLVAPFFIRQARNPTLIAFLDGVISAATGAVVGLVFILGRQALTGPFPIGVALGTLAVLFFFKKFPTVWLVLGSALLGLLFPAT